MTNLRALALLPSQIPNSMLLLWLILMLGFLTQENQANLLSVFSGFWQFHITNASLFLGHGHHSIRLASWRWKEYNDYFVICVMVAFAAVAKLIFHETHWLSSRFPESCVLIIVGVIFGHIIHYGLESHAHHFPK